MQKRYTVPSLTSIASIGVVSERQLASARPTSTTDSLGIIDFYLLSVKDEAIRFWTL